MGWDGWCGLWGQGGTVTRKTMAAPRAQPGAILWASWQSWSGELKRGAPQGPNCTWDALLSSAWHSSAGSARLGRMARRRSPLPAAAAHPWRPAGSQLCGRKWERSSPGFVPAAPATSPRRHIYQYREQDGAGGAQNLQTVRYPELDGTPKDQQAQLLALPEPLKPYV